MFISMTGREVRSCFYKCIEESVENYAKWLQDEVITQDFVAIMELEDALVFWIEQLGPFGIIGNNTYLAIEIKDEYYDEICKKGLIPIQCRSNYTRT
jgi:hypothetical protein